jgi:RNA polymerase sigma factor (sigma-70 family)
MRAISSQHIRYTAPDTDTFALYLREIRAYRPLSREEEQQAFARYKTPATPAWERAQAHKKLMLHNQLFLVTVAKQFHTRQVAVSLGDLVQAGNIGLLEAIERYEPSTNLKFITYAVWWLRKYMSEELVRYDSLIERPPHHFFREQRQLRAAYQAELTSTAASAAALPFTPRIGVVSLDAPLGEDDFDGHACYPSQSRQAQAEDERVEHLQQYTRRALGQLKPISARLLTLLFGLDGSEPASKEYAAQQLGVSVETMRKMQQRAQQELKEALLTLTGQLEEKLAEEFLCS